MAAMDHVVALDFSAKRIERIAPSDLPVAIAGGAYCWADMERGDDADALLRQLGVEATTIERIADNRCQAQVRIRSNALHCTLVEAAMAGDELVLRPIHVVLGQGFLISLRSGPSTVLDKVRETYEDDFHGAARSGGFLLFEIADHLIDGFRQTLADLSRQVDRIQETLLDDIGDEILVQVSDLTRDLLEYRNAAVAAREAIDELATRKSPYVEPSTQPFLDRQTLPLDRLANDAATERTVLSESVNLYMGLVSHRTNKVVNRLTIVSVIFLPLNFLAAVYGMNFESMPELGWRYGYAAFWGVVCLLVAGLLLYLRKRRWL